LDITVAASNPLILEEIAARLDPEGYVDIRDFGRHLLIRGLDHSKQIELKLESEDDSVVLVLKLSKVQSESDFRNIIKYLRTSKDKAVSKLKKGPFKEVHGDIDQGRLDVYAHCPLKAVVSEDEIERIYDILFEVRCAMTLG